MLAALADLVSGCASLPNVDLMNSWAHLLTKFPCALSLQRVFHAELALGSPLPAEFDDEYVKRVTYGGFFRFPLPETAEPTSAE